MTERDERASDRQGHLDGYEPPRVERVLTSAELDREVLYAGDQPSGVP